MSVAHKLLLLSGDDPVLSRAEAFWKTSQYSGSGSLLDLSGHGHDLAFPGGAANPTWLHAGRKYVYCPGVAANFISTPDAAGLDIVGDIDIRGANAITDYTPAAIERLVYKSTATGNQRSYAVRLNTAGTLSLMWSVLGVADITATSTVGLAVTAGVADGAILAWRVTLDVDNGAVGNDVKFYWKLTTEATAAADVASDAGWTQLGTTVTTAVATAIFASTATLRIGDDGEGTGILTSKVYAVCIKNGINGTTVVNTSFDHANVVEPYATFNDGTRVWTFNRSATGKKLAVVDRSMLLFGTDDYLSTPDHPLLDFAAGDSFTVAAVLRRFSAPAALEVFLSKKSAISGSDAGYYLYHDNGNRQVRLFLADGAVGVVNLGPNESDGVLFAATGIRDVSLDKIQTYVNSAAGPLTTDTTTASIANAIALRIGSTGAGMGFAPMEFAGAAVFRESLSATDIARLVTDLAAA